MKEILALVAEGLGQVGAGNPTGNNDTNTTGVNCGIESLQKYGSSLVIKEDAAALMAVFAGIGWAVATIVYHLPVSSSTRATAASIRDHALFAMVLAGTGSAISQLVSYITQKAAEYVTGVPNPEMDPSLMLTFNVVSVALSATFLSILTGLFAIGPSIPVIGTFLTFAAAVVYSPAAALLGVILVTSAMNSVGYFILSYSMTTLFPVGIVLFASPGRIAKGLGALFVSLAIVSHIALNVLPYIVAALMSAIPGGVNVKDLLIFLQNLGSECEKNRMVGADAFLALFNPMSWYMLFIQWFVGVIASSFLLVMVYAAARALSQSLGGVSVNL
jgi:hypothetical protein